MPHFHIDVRLAQEVSAGYYFIALKPVNTVQTGPYIFDPEGRLVWSGASLGVQSTSVALHRCRFRGVDHLCFWEGKQVTTLGRGRVLILDQTYQPVAAVSGVNVALDFHEFNILPDGVTALATVYKPLQFDLSSHGLPSQLGWIYNSGFQELDITTGELLFEWLAADHISTLETIRPLQINREGQTASAPWDYFHINSVDKTRDGDYVLSSRHTSTIYKISGQNGTVLWRLGGQMSNFSSDFSIGFQHHVRIREETGDLTKLSLFNNMWDGIDTPGVNATSTGMLISLDHRTGYVSVIQEYRSAPGDTSILSASQGNLEEIPNSSNVFLNWGSGHRLTEHSENGDVILNASIAGGVVDIYRASKGPWVGRPKDPPSLWNYAFNSSSPTVSYFSWNGATKVAMWRLYGLIEHTALYDAIDGDLLHTSPSNSPQLLGQTPHQGFETTYVHAKYVTFVMVEALDIANNSLANSSLVRTFVPSTKLAEQACDELACHIELVKRLPSNQTQSTRPMIRPTPLMPLWQFFGPRMTAANSLGGVSMGYTGLLATSFTVIGFLFVLSKLGRIVRPYIRGLKHGGWSNRTYCGKDVGS